MTARARFWLAGCTLAAALSGCGDGDAPPPAAGQVIAAVNGQELTVHQLQAELAATAGAQPPADLDAAKAGAALDLVDRALLTQQARAAGLDREAVLLAQLARAQDRVLAAAWLQRIAADAAQPTDTAVRAYYDANPDLFAQRHAWLLAQVVTDGTVPREVLDQRGREFASAGALVQWLRERGAPAELRTVTLGAEQVPAPVRERLRDLKPGQALVASMGGMVQINYLLESRPAPVTLSDAQAGITALLTAQARQDAINAEMTRLREAAQIGWAGEFERKPPQRPAGAPLASGAQATGGGAGAKGDAAAAGAAGPSVVPPAPDPAGNGLAPDAPATPAPASDRAPAAASGAGAP